MTGSLGSKIQWFFKGRFQISSYVLLISEGKQKQTRYMTI